MHETALRARLCGGPSVALSRIWKRVIRSSCQHGMRCMLRARDAESAESNAEARRPTRNKISNAYSLKPARAILARREGLRSLGRACVEEGTARYVAEMTPTRRHSCF